MNKKKYQTLNETNPDQCKRLPKEIIHHRRNVTQKNKK